jgi:NAD(P)-dependent dehydrogenase (short-subunit alcohol dehydrogenase family)
MPEIDLSERTVVVTGASRGIGAAIARHAERAGMRIGVCARSESVLAASNRVVSARLDVVDEDAMVAFAKQVESSFGAIDLWINNAGVLSPIAPVRSLSTREFRTHIDINLTGVFIGTRIYLEHRRRHGGGGVLINISSGAASNPYAGWGAYCASKAGVERLTEVVALEEHGSGLRAYSVAPGVVDTDMQSQIRDCSPDRFPKVADFVAMKKENRFNSGEYVARQLLGLAFDPTHATEQVAIRIPYEYEQG